MTPYAIRPSDCVADTTVDHYIAVRRGPLTFALDETLDAEPVLPLTAEAIRNAVYTTSANVECRCALTLTTADGTPVTLTADELAMTYRHTALMERDLIVTGAILQLQPGDYDTIWAKMKELMARRHEKQPLEYPSAGSFFKRPEGYFAGKLIQDAGLKGFTVGGAQVSEKHAGFVINRGGATAADLVELRNQVHDKVFAEFGVHLEPEVRFVGEF